MTAQSCSVIVVSRDRPDALRRCLLGLSQLYHPVFEVVLVADAAGLQAAADLGLNTRIKKVLFEEANISAARNLGIAQAAGQVLAFIDDDAVPEPTWLTRLTRPFADGKVHSATGFVLGRNGITYQWKAAEVDTLGRDRPLKVPPEGAILTAPKGRAIKTVGTNAAFRAQTLRQIGGFDPAYRFFLDETDVNMRLAALSHPVAVVPDAQVHHGFAASAQRHANRTPRNLTEIGASTVVYLRRYARADQVSVALDELRREQTKRLEDFVQRGALDRGATPDLLAGLEAGIERGFNYPLTGIVPMTCDAPKFVPFGHNPPAAHITLTGRPMQKARLMGMAKKAIENSQIASIFLFDATPRAHRVAFEEPGIWVQTGGLFGRSDRSQPRFAFWRRSSRYAAERARAGSLREF